MKIKFFQFENVKSVLIEIAIFFEKAGIPYGFNAGTAAYFYGSARDLDDIDVLTTKEGVDAFAKEYSAKPFLKQEGMFHNYLVKTSIKGIDVDVVANLIIVKDRNKHPFDFDAEMIKNLKKIKLNGQDIFLLSPEDVVAFKSITQREGGMVYTDPQIGVQQETGKFDLTDIKNILATGKVDEKKVEERLKKCGYAKN